MSEEQTTKTTEKAPGRARPSDGLSLADLRDAVRLRQDLTRLEDENRFLREQLAQAVTGWRGEQQRTQALEQALSAPPAPAEAEPQKEAPSEKEAPSDVSAPPTPIPPAGESSPPAEPPGFWFRLWQSLMD